MKKIMLNIIGVGIFLLASLPLVVLTIFISSTVATTLMKGEVSLFFGIWSIPVTVLLWYFCFFLSLFFKVAKSKNRQFYAFILLTPIVAIVIGLVSIPLSFFAALALSRLSLLF